MTERNKRQASPPLSLSLVPTLTILVVVMWPLSFLQRLLQLLMPEDAEQAAAAELCIASGSKYLPPEGILVTLASNGPVTAGDIAPRASELQLAYDKLLAESTLHRLAVSSQTARSLLDERNLRVSVGLKRLACA